MYYILIGIYISLVSLLCPVLGLLASIYYLLFSKKNYRFSLAIFILIVSYIGSFYLPADNHDMARYIDYMGKIPLNNIKYFFSQMYSPTPVSVYGLNGQEWPGSALLLYITAKYGNYRILSGLTLGIVYFVRFYAIKDTYSRSKTHKSIYLIVYLFAITTTIRPLLPLSGFRWFLAISVLMFCAYLENLNGFKTKYIILYVIAATFHPGSIIFIVLRIASLIFSNEKRSRNIGICIVSIGLLLTIIARSRITGLMDSLFDHFSAYTIGTVGGLQAIDTILNIVCLILIFARTIALIKKETALGIRHNSLNYLLTLVIFNLALMTVPIFDRFTQFIIPVSLIILSKYSFSESKWKLKDYIIPSYIFILGFFEMIIISYATFPNLIEPLWRILVFPIHF